MAILQTEIVHARLAGGFLQHPAVIHQIQTQRRAGERIRIDAADAKNAVHIAALSVNEIAQSCRGGRQDATVLVSCAG